MKTYDIDYVRSQFPAMAETFNGYKIAYLDGPGGTQVPERVVNKISEYLYRYNANEHGAFHFSHKTEAMMQEARETFAAFLGCSSDEIAFGANSTTNNFMLSQAIKRDIKPGDEVLITQMDHYCNQSPWRQLEEAGAHVKMVRVEPQTSMIDFQDFKEKLSSKTKVVAINYAANATGAITDVRPFIELAHEANAITIVDAVHYAAHKPVDVKSIGTDILICSSYKFFGPHLGIAYIKKDLFEHLKTIRVDADDIVDAPVKFQTGTPNFEHIAGASEAVKFIMDIGQRFGQMYDKETAHLIGMRKEIVAGMLAIDDYEEKLAEKLRRGLRAIPGVKIYGTEDGKPRTTTVSFTLEGKHANEIARVLADKGIYVWDGDFYAEVLVNEVYKLADVGGLLRIGFAPYNTEEDVIRTLETVKALAE